MEAERHGHVWTPEEFAGIDNGAIFAQGILLDDYSCYPIQATGNVVRWVAVKGDVEDWAVYYQDPSLGHLVQEFDEVAMHGDKLYHPLWIMNLVPSVPEMMQLYRY